MDFVSVVRHVLKSGEQHGVNTQKVCIAGISGGGWIAVGAANLMAKAGDLCKIRGLFLHSGMISNETYNLKKEELKDYEREWGK